MPISSVHCGFRVSIYSPHPGGPVPSASFRKRPLPSPLVGGWRVHRTAPVPRVPFVFGAWSLVRATTRAVSNRGSLPHRSSSCGCIVQALVPASLTFLLTERVGWNRLVVREGECWGCWLCDGNLYGMRHEFQFDRCERNA